MNQTGFSEAALAEAIEFIDPWLRRRHESLDMPGFVVAISYMGSIAYKGAFGVSDIENGTELSPDSVFRIGSQSKSFTAAAIMQLQEAEILSIDELACSYVPELKTHHDARWQMITIEQLLSHSAGVMRDGRDADFWELKRDFPDRQRLIQDVLSADLVLDPGTQMKYSNLGYGLLGCVIENASGKSYDEYIREGIIEPLGLMNTGTDYLPSTDTDIAIGYGRRGSEKKRSAFANITARSLSPATGFYSTAEDVCTYFNSLLLKNANTVLLSEESKRAMQQTRWPVKNSQNVEYGLGIDIGYVNDRRIIGHGGGYLGHLTNTFVDVEDEVIITAMTNCIDGDALSITLGVTEALQYFRPRPVAKDSDLRRFNSCVDGLWSTRQILVSGDRIVSFEPNTWHPFVDCEELAYVDESTLVVKKANGFDSEGEHVRFTFDDQDLVQAVNYCGRSMLPE